MPVTDVHGYVQFFVVNLVLSSFTTHQQIFNISVVHVAQSEVFWSIVRLFTVSFCFCSSKLQLLITALASSNLFLLWYVRLVYRFRSQCLFFNLYSCPVSHLKFIHKVRDHKRQAKFDLRFYHYSHSEIFPLDLSHK